MTTVIWILALLALILIVCWLSFLSRVNEYLPLVQQANQELDVLCTPMHFFTEEEERDFIEKYSSLKEIVEKA